MRGDGYETYSHLVDPVDPPRYDRGSLVYSGHAQERVGDGDINW